MKDKVEEISVVENRIDIELNIYPQKQFGKPRLLLKCVVQDPDRIKDILKKAFSDQKLLSEIMIRNKWAAIPKLIEMGMLKKEDVQDQIFKEFLK